MRLFGARRAVSAFHIDAILVVFAEGLILAQKAERDPREGEKVEFAQHASEALKLAGVHQIRDLPSHMLAHLNALRCALWGDADEFEASLKTIGPKQAPLLREIRREAGRRRLARYQHQPSRNDHDSPGPRAREAVLSDLFAHAGTL